MAKLTGIDQAIRAFYGQKQVAEQLTEAILYSVDSGGKRIRPLLLLEVVAGFGLDLTPAHYQVAAALEMIHTGSLIHDDLPAMDDDDYRRGRLTSHKQFDEATAILAGDSLFLDPFGLVAESDLPPQVRLALVRELSYASGTYGMVAGQILDMAGEGQDLDLPALQAIHANKTGKLLAFPFVAAGLIAEQDDQVLALLRRLGDLVGLAFQVRDDILDVTASFEDLGKTPKKDLESHKATYPSLLGLSASYEMLNTSLDQAKALVQELEENQGFQPEAVLQMIERLRCHA